MHSEHADVNVHGVAAPRNGEDYSLKYISFELRRWFRRMDGYPMFLEANYNTAHGLFNPINCDVEPPRHWLQHPLVIQEQSHAVDELGGFHGLVVYNHFRWDRGLGRPLENYDLKMRTHEWYVLCFRVKRAAARRLNSIVFQAWHTVVQRIRTKLTLCRCRVGLGPELLETITSFLEPESSTWTIRLLGWEWKLQKRRTWLDELVELYDTAALRFSLERMNWMMSW